MAEPGKGLLKLKSLIIQMRKLRPARTEELMIRVELA